MELPPEIMAELQTKFDEIMDSQEHKVLALLEILRYNRDERKLTVPIPVFGDMLFAITLLESMMQSAPNDQLTEMVRTRILRLAMIQRKDNGSR